MPWNTWQVTDWERIFKVNVTGMWLCCKAIAPIMEKAGSGKIINIASIVARVPAAQMFLPYACSKGAVYTLTHALARALGPANINVNGNVPSTKTPWTWNSTMTGIMRSIHSITPRVHSSMDGGILSAA